MYDFFYQNIEISLLAFFLLLSIAVFYISKNEYVKQKSLWRIYIIIASFLLFINDYLKLFLLGFVIILSIYEFWKVIDKKNIWWIISIVVFAIIILAFGYEIFNNTNNFFYLFIMISFSDMVAYIVWKWLPRKKWFTKLSPNKTLSGFLWQIWFLALWCIFLLDFNIILSIIIWILAPIWDLAESYFKRKAKIKDMAEYIPWHWWILDRIDSSIFPVLTLFIYNILKNGF